MATRKVKFSISIKELNLEYEGSQEIGQRIHQGVTHALGSLINAQDRLLAAPPRSGQVIDAGFSDAGASKANGQDSPDGNSEKPKQSRQRRTKGTSLIGLLRSLKKEGFFVQARPVSEIKERLKDKGHNYSDSNISARLQDLTKKDELFRDSSGEVYVYRGTPFNEGERNHNLFEKAAE